MYCMDIIWRYDKVSDEHTCVKSKTQVTWALLCYAWVWVAEWSWREKEAKGEEEIVLSYDERLDWLESDDCSKWPGRWLHLCSRSPGLFYLLPPLTCFPTYTSLSLRASLCHPLSLVSSWQPINRVPLSPLMAQLLALMHFKRTAAATSQSDGKYMSSSNLRNLFPFFHPILFLCSMCYTSCKPSFR